MTKENNIIFSLLRVVAVLICVGPVSAQAKPARILSANLCADQLAFRLADRDRIVSASHLITDPEFFPGGVEGIPPNYGEIEEIVSYEPDLVLTGNSMPALTERFLEELGYPVVSVPLVMSVAEARAVIRQAAAALGESPRGEDVIRELDQRLQAATAPPELSRPVAVVFGPNGYTSGRGTLIHELLTLAGWDNLAARSGIVGWGVLDLEQVLLGAPDAVIFDQYGADQVSQAQDILKHPALARLTAQGQVLTVPVRYWLCGNMLIAEAAEILAMGAARARAGKVND